jgi:histidinol-phosphatase (PHP family)
LAPGREVWRLVIDFHVHCDFSVDAVGSAGDYAREALEKGLREVCFTTHCDLDPERRDHDGRVRVDGEITDVTSDWLGRYVDTVRESAGAYGERGLTILCGLEVGYTHGIEKMIEEAVGAFDFDYILGGVHTLEGVDIVSSTDSKAYFARRSPEQICELYYRSVGEAVRSDLFDAIAHLDIYKRCGLDFYGEALNVAHRGLAEPVLDDMAARDLALEVNSGGLRKGLRWPYPSPDILLAARKAGVACVTVGSDAHSPEQVGTGLGRCLDAALGAGFDKVAIFRKRSRREIPLEEVYG